ncbi:unnamed protein product [Effrenium voratum]|uniref:Uncharacterized protein n=1 Tax=Effrenium voratum TaxID=2562239 RepID=A0AA36JCC8_9DINO|nr:unnamed protein product [Effrenium voratum]
MHPSEDGAAEPQTNGASEPEAIEVGQEDSAESPRNEEEAELAEWQHKVAAQRENIAQSERERGELRAEVERLQQAVASLTSERDRLLRGGAARDAEDKNRELEAKLESLREEKTEIESGLAQQEAELAQARRLAAQAAESGDAAAEELREEEARLEKQQQSVAAAEAAAAAAEQRLQSMVSVEEVQRCEKEAKSYREALVSVDKEARQLRLALADALSSGTDLSMAKRELEVLRDAQEAASQRVKALESVNDQLENRIAQVEGEIASLRKGTVDLRSEEDLMREVIVSQSEQLLRRVEDLTAEEKLAAEDRRQLLATAAQLADEVEKAEERVARHSELEEQCIQLDAAQQTLSAEVERLRRTNDALCQQVLGSDGEGPFTGALEQVSVLDGEEDQAIRDEIGRLVRGQLLLTSQAGSVKADAAALALRLQQLLAEREEAFWVERQRLSDHIISLERTNASVNGRTSNLLRHYDAAVRNASSTEPPASLVSGGLRRLRQTIGA